MFYLKKNKLYWRQSGAWVNVYKGAFEFESKKNAETVKTAMGDEDVRVVWLNDIWGKK